MLESLGSIALSAFLFLLFSRLTDLYISGLHLPLITSVTCLAILILRGRFGVIYNSVPGLLLTGLTIWYLMALPFSSWRGGSVQIFREDWSKSYLVFVLIAGLVTTSTHALRAIRIVGYGLFAAAIFSFVAGLNVLGRVSLQQGAYGNPNDYGTMLAIGATLWWFFAHNGRYHPLLRLVSIVIALFICYVLLRTGSRAALLSVVAAAAAAFFYYSMQGRAIFLVTSFVGAVLLVGAMPDTLQRRFATFFSQADADSADEETLQQQAVGSSHSRLELLRQSVILTLKNPVFGVGMGMFAVAENDLAKESGRKKGQWLVTHNTYTQVSSENGILAILLFVGTICSSLLMLRRIRTERLLEHHPQGAEIALAAQALNLAVISMMVNFMFSSMAYLWLLPALAGLCYALYATTRTEAAYLRRSIAAGTPLPEQTAQLSSSPARPPTRPTFPPVPNLTRRPANALRRT